MGKPYATNGVLIGTGAATEPKTTAAGAADTVLRVPTAGGEPAFGTISLTAGVTGILPVANGGTGVASAAATDPTAVYNYLFNSDFEIWGAGTSAVPTGWTDTDGSGSYLKNTTANQFRTGTASVQITRTAGAQTLTQDVMAIYPTSSFWFGNTVTFGCWVRATVASRAAISITETGAGAGTTASSYHSGGSSFEFLTVTRTLNAAVTGLTVNLVVEGGNTAAQFDSCILVIGATVAEWVPSGWRGRKAILSFSSGSVAMGTNPSYYAGGHASTVEAGMGAGAPFKGVARNLYATADANTSVTDTLRNATGDSALVATFGGGTTASDLTHESEFAKGAQIDMKSTEAGSIRHQANVEYEEIP